MCVTQKVVCKVALLNGANAHRCNVSSLVPQYSLLLFSLQISHELFNLSNFCHIQLPAVVKALFMG
jgi:hypothetical protein